jgi:hypothetical protein
MQITKQTPVLKAGGHEPQHNLPRFNARRGAENRFALQFARVYRAAFSLLPDHKKQKNMAFAREIPANGYGIADLVSVTWNPKTRSGRTFWPVEEFISGTAHTVRAFELKMSDWRKALQQASRYRFFAHVPIAVLPAAKSRMALENLEIFQTLRVGLWTFDPKTAVIHAHFTPAAEEPRDTKHHIRTVRLLAKVTKALPVA